MANVANNKVQTWTFFSETLIKQGLVICVFLWFVILLLLEIKTDLKCFKQAQNSKPSSNSNFLLLAVLIRVNNLFLLLSVTSLGRFFQTCVLVTPGLEIGEMVVTRTGRQSNKYLIKAIVLPQFLKQFGQSWALLTCKNFSFRSRECSCIIISCTWLFECVYFSPSHIMLNISHLLYGCARMFCTSEVFYVHKCTFYLSQGREGGNCCWERGLEWLILSAA